MIVGIHLEQPGTSSLLFLKTVCGGHIVLHSEKVTVHILRLDIPTSGKTGRLHMWNMCNPVTYTYDQPPTSEYKANYCSCKVAWHGLEEHYNI